MKLNEPEITDIYVWTNCGMVMTFDQNGRQMPDYQGPYEEVIDKIKRDAPVNARWHQEDWNKRRNLT
jgi:hypothetical protein